MKKLIPYLYCLLLLITQGRFVDAQSITKLGDNYYSAGIPSMEFYQVGEIDRQRCPEWCWAASSQMILNYHGLYVSQEQIVTKIFGSLQCRPGTPSDILNGLTGWAPDTRGRYSTIHSIYGISSTTDIVQNLAYKWPLLVCLSNPDGSGHALVMTAVYYAVDAYNNPIIEKVVLRDPWPYNPSRQEMSWAEFSGRVSAIIRVWVERN